VKLRETLIMLKEQYKIPYTFYGRIVGISDSMVRMYVSGHADFSDMNETKMRKLVNDTLLLIQSHKK